tara:strand:+ start:163 stop:429 length:267 start_codon:yes stop_codon:yes gene_type:complete
MNTQEIHKKIIAFLIKENKISEEDVLNININTDFIECGIIDSIGVLELLVFIEEEFILDLQKISITTKNMKSLSSISDFILSNKNDKQ